MQWLSELRRPVNVDLCVMAPPVSGRKVSVKAHAGGGACGLERPVSHFLFFEQRACKWCGRVSSRVRVTGEGPLCDVCAR